MSPENQGIFQLMKKEAQLAIARDVLLLYGFRIRIRSRFIVRITAKRNIYCRSWIFKEKRDRSGGPIFEKVKLSTTDLTVSDLAPKSPHQQVV